MSAPGLAHAVPALEALEEASGEAGAGVRDTAGGVTAHVDVRVV